MRKKGFFSKKKAKTFLKGSPGMPVYRIKNREIYVADFSLRYPTNTQLFRLWDTMTLCLSISSIEPTSIGNGIDQNKIGLSKITSKP